MPRRKRRPIPQQPTPAYPPVQYGQPTVYAPPDWVPPPTASVSTLSAKNATVAKVAVSKISDLMKGVDYKFEAAESAKREQGDRYDPQTGELLAMGRAFIDVGEQMLREGNKRVQASVKEQEQARLRSLQRKLAKAEPPKRRTKEEWEAMQRQQAGTGTAYWSIPRENTTLAQPVEDWGSVQGGRISLRDGRYIEVLDDAAHVRNADGSLVLRFER